MVEFQDYCVAPDNQLPGIIPSQNVAVDHFWAAMAEQKAITDSASLRFGTLAQQAKTLLILPHSNADPERLFSMVIKIETEQWKRFYCL